MTHIKSLTAKVETQTQYKTPHRVRPAKGNEIATT